MTRLVIAALLATTTLAQLQSQCLQPSGSIRPSVASGYQLQVVATGLSSPRDILLDPQGRLLVVEQGRGAISAHTINDGSNGCTTFSSSKDLVNNTALNHGIELDAQNNILYASDPEAVYAWNYDVNALTATNQVQIIDGMNNSDHSTRTLLLSKKVPGLMVVSRGSQSNLDILSANISTGHAQVKAFNMANRTGMYNYETAGLRLAWGVRNEVGVAEHPITGGIWGVENSADQIERYGVDVSNNNPGEELNYFGYLNGTPYAEQGQFFGYPWCLTAWNVSELPQNGNLTTGSPFAFDGQADTDNENRTDAFCATTVPPRLTFQAHMAPLDIKFNNSAQQAWITFHGSWDRKIPVGYKLSVVQFNSSGQPVADRTSTTAATDIISNMDNTACPSNCFRPVGLAFDNKGRIFMSSDASGEIYLVTRTTADPATSSSASSSAGAPSSTSSASAAAGLQVDGGLVATALSILAWLM